MIIFFKVPTFALEKMHLSLIPKGVPYLINTMNCTPKLSLLGRMSKRNGGFYENLKLSRSSIVSGHHKKHNWRPISMRFVKRFAVLDRTIAQISALPLQYSANIWKLEYHWTITKNSCSKMQYLFALQIGQIW